MFNWKNEPKNHLIQYLENPLLLKLKTTIEIERRIIMWKKLLILSLSIVMLFVITAPVDAGNKSVNVNWQITGTIVQTIDVTSPNPSYPIQDPVPYSLINLTADGSPGPAKITLLSKSTIYPPPCDDDVDIDCFECADGYGYPVYFDKNDMVAIFPDQSLLFASIDEEIGGILCFSMTGTTYFKVQMNVISGTGRFEGVSEGTLIGEGNGYPVGFDSILAGEIGKITGKIDFSD